MDSTINVVSESNIESTTGRVDSVTNTGNMDSASNVTSENTSNMDSTDNVPVVVSNTEYEKAISDLMKNLDLAKETGDKNGEMKAYLDLSNAYAITEQYDEAVCHAKECIRIIQEISVKKATEMDDRSSLVAGVYIKDASLGASAARAYYNLAESEAYLALSEDSLYSFQKCAAIATEISDEKLKLMSNYWIAKLYEAKSQWNDVIGFSKKYIDKMSLFFPKEMEIEAYLRLATAFFETSIYEKAVVYGKKCIGTLGESPDVNGHTKRSALAILSRSYLKLNNYDEAVNCGKKFLEISTNTGNKETEMEGHYLLALAYDQLHQIYLSYNHVTQGMAIAKELKHSTAMERFRSLLSDFYATIGMPEMAFFFADSNTKTMLEVPTCLEQEMKALLKAKEAKDIDQQIRCQFRLYNFYKSKFKFQSAVHCLKEGMKLQPNNSEAKLSYYVYITEMYMAMKKYEEWLEYCEGGLREVAACKDKKIVFYFFFYISLLYAANEKWRLAEKYIKEAVQCFEALYGSVGSNDVFKMSMIDKYHECYKLLAWVYLETNRKKEALLVLDKCRARALKDILVDNYGMQENEQASNMQFSDIEELLSNNQFVILYHSICGFGNALRFFVGHKCFEAVPQRIRISEKELNRLIDNMFEIEVLRKVKCEDRTLDTKQDVKFQKQKEEAEDDEQRELVFWSRLRERRFVVHKKKISLYDNDKCLPATALELLYFLIIGENQSSINKQSEIIFIPDGSLCKIPFAALQDPDTGKYLSETKRIRLAPSIATLKLLSENVADYHCNGGALIIGDPDVGKVMLNGNVTELSRLKSAQKEANIVARTLGVEPLIGNEATKAAVLEKLQQGVSVVHIAAHGKETNGTIALAPSPEIRATKIPDEEDYMLTMADVQQAKVRAQLVVLSCCNSGRGEIRAEGVVGMCRAFLASGARAVVASLWAIYDEATLKFMVIFYGHLKNGKSASTSLQLAMNEMRSIDEYKEPKYWAPFFLMGDDVTLKFT